MNKALGLIIILLLLGVAGFVLINTQSKPEVEKEEAKTVPKLETSAPDTSSQFTFQTPKKSAHFESNTPEHGAVFAGVPINVVINFNFDLAEPSDISITGSDNKEYGVGETIIDQNKLVLRKVMDQSSPDGKYKVTYNACWPDKNCHDGYFEFAVDRSKQKSFINLKNRKELTIDMKDIKFQPENILISPGTKITWINIDNVDHFINTESHPAHTYYPEQNSRALKKGDKYTLTFNKPGIYLYHCSAHEAYMKGAVVVD